MGDLVLSEGIDALIEKGEGDEKQLRETLTITSKSEIIQKVWL